MTVTIPFAQFTHLEKAVVSTDSAEAKLGVAQQMYTAQVGAGRSVRIGGTFTATWADGGTSRYLVQNNGVGNLKLSLTPPIETPGDGVPKPGPICRRG